MSLTTPLDKYISDHSSPEGDYLYRLFRATHVEILAPQMASGHVQGRFLKFLVKMINPKRILEIGTFTGYSALLLTSKGYNVSHPAKKIHNMETIIFFILQF